jgi:iron complex transport system permease protein
MKITLDLGELVAQGKLTQAEAERLQGFAQADTGALGTNILLAFGTVGVAGGLGVLLPTPETAIGIGALLLGMGLWLTVARVVQWLVFAQIVMVVGALAFFGGLWAVLGDSLYVKVVLSLGLAAVAVFARSGMLASLATVMFAAALVTGFEFWEPTHYLAVTIVVLAALVLGLYVVSLRLTPAYERLAILAMRTAIIMINFAFLAGSLFGDEGLGISAVAFSVAWALALLAFGTWAVLVNRRWVVNSVAIFGAVHFFTQWFLVLGAQPFSILGGGLLLIGFGLALARFNQWVSARKQAIAGESGVAPSSDGWKRCLNPSKPGLL